MRPKLAVAASCVAALLCTYSCNRPPNHGESLWDVCNLVHSHISAYRFRHLKLPETIEELLANSPLLEEQLPGVRKLAITWTTTKSETSSGTVEIRIKVAGSSREVGELYDYPAKSPDRTWEVCYITYPASG